MQRTLTVMVSSHLRHSTEVFERFIREAPDEPFLNDVAEIEVLCGIYPEDSIAGHAELTLEDGVDADAMLLEAEHFYDRGSDVAATVVLQPTEAERRAARREQVHAHARYERQHQ